MSERNPPITNESYDLHRRIYATVRVYGNISNPEELPDDQLIEIFRQIEYVRSEEFKRQAQLRGYK